MRALRLFILLALAPSIALAGSSGAARGPSTYAGSASAGGPATTALALNADPAACTAQVVTDIAAAGTLTCSQPQFSWLGGVATTAQIGTGTPGASKYVDGATGAWTALPTSGDSPGGADATLQYRVNSTTLGGVTSSSVSGANITLGGTLGGITQLDVDNVRVDLNTISTTNSNGNLTLAANGTGAVVMPAGDVSTPSVVYAGATTTGTSVSSNRIVTFLGGTRTELFSASGRELRRDRQYGFAPTDFSTAIDAGLASPAVGVVRVTNGGAGIGRLLTGRLVEANTAGSGAPNILALDESATVLTNEGSTAKNYHTLPTAASGYEFTFVVQDADGIRVVANTGDTVRIAAAVSAAAGYCESTTIGDSVTVVSINATEWVAKAVVGAGWTCT